MRRLNPQQVQELLGVSNDTLRCWRRPQRLAKGKADPLYLPAEADPTNPNVVWYQWDVIKQFLLRNEKYRERLYASYVPEEVRHQLFPLTITNPPPPYIGPPIGLDIIIQGQPQP